MTSTLTSLCKKNLLNLSNSSEDVAMHVDTNKSQNLELLRSAADFVKFLAAEDVMHLCLPPGDAKINITDRSLIQFRL